MKTFWKASIVQIAEKDIYKAKCSADDAGAMEKWLRLFI